MKFLIKLYNAFYVYYLKLFYFKRFRLQGHISSNGLFYIELSKGAQLIIDGDITLSRGTLLAVRKNAFLKIGKGCFFNRQCSVVCRDEVHIGEETLIGENVKIYDNDHKIVDGYVSKNEYTTLPVTIGSHCWLGNDVHILKGSSLPSNTIIAAKGLVNRQLETAGVYAGIPVVWKKYIS